MDISLLFLIYYFDYYRFDPLICLLPIVTCLLYHLVSLSPLRTFLFIPVLFVSFFSAFSFSLLMFHLSHHFLFSSFPPSSLLFSLLCSPPVSFSLVSYSFAIFSTQFLDAFSHLYKGVSVRPSVRPSVRWSVGHTRVEFLRNRFSGLNLNKIVSRT